MSWTTRLHRPAHPADRLAGPLHAPPQRGQALVEFAFVLLPVLLILVGIIQFGLLFGANVTLTNAAREGTRAGTIYVYDRTHTKAWNDAARCGAIVNAAEDAFGMLTAGAPHFTVTLSGTSCPTPSGDTQVNGDLTVSYCASVDAPDDPCPDAGDSTTTCVPDTREGCLLRVTLVYHTDIIVPLVSTFLSTDGNGRFAQRVTATMVVN
ncbi:MAG TPA: TadE family protein [Candidatus Limnocylindria bacterium]|nr:TadE family protein [Candidatus Limnocylindria bacterium]